MRKHLQPFALLIAASTAPAKAAPQQSPANPNQAVLKAGVPRTVINPDVLNTITAPGPDEGKVEVKLLGGGGKVQFLGFTCAIGSKSPQQTCSRNAKKGSSVQLVALPAEGYRFAGWTSGCAQAGAKKQCSLQVNDSLVSTTAVFIKNAGPMVTLTVVYGTPPMMGLRLTTNPDTELTCTVDKGGMGAGIPTKTCTAQFEQGSTITLKAEDWFGTATAIDPKRWGGACKGSTSAVCKLKMDQPQAVDVAYSY